MVNYINELVLAYIIIFLPFTIYIFQLKKKVKILHVQNEDLEEFLSLETTVKSLIEVIRQEANIYTSSNIICNTLANLLKAEGMGVYRIIENKIESTLGEHFKEPEIKHLYKKHLSNELINIGETNSINSKNIEVDNKLISLITMLINNIDKTFSLVVIFKKEVKEKNDNFIFQVLYYCTHLTSLILDIKQKVEVDKLILEKEKSEQQAMELAEKLEQEIKNSELQNEFIGIISHEFRTPLTVIASSIKLLQMNITHMYSHLSKIIDNIKHASSTQIIDILHRQESTLKEDLRLNKIEEQIKNINNYILKFSTLIETTMNLSIIESCIGQKNCHYTSTKINLKTMLEEAVANFKHFRDGISIEIDFDDHSHIIYFDKVSLYLVLSNLISNAIKFSKATGKVIIKLFLKENTSVLTIEDQGIGIPKENQGQIFKKFYRAHNAKTTSGTGIGLYLANKLMEFNGGSINIESELNKGTKIILSFFNDDKNGLKGFIAESNPALMSKQNSIIMGEELNG